MKNNFGPDYADYADLQYQIRNNLIPEYADCDDFIVYTINSSLLTTLNMLVLNHIKINSPLTALIFETT